jgi:hypothetical protein
VKDDREHINPLDFEPTPEGPQRSVLLTVIRLIWSIMVAIAVIIGVLLLFLLALCALIAPPHH